MLGNIVLLLISWWTLAPACCAQMIKCSVCQDKKKNRVITKCYHMFCDGCLEKSIKVGCDGIGGKHVMMAIQPYNIYIVRTSVALMLRH